jgi:hypothetical protein
MGHYAKVIDNIVVDVNVATQEWIDAQSDNWAWVETSYNIRGGVYYDPETREPHKDQSLATATAGRRRKNYAAIGSTYDKERDAFIYQKPFESWKLNEDTCLWEAPIPMPDDKKEYLWNETTKNWTYTGWYYNEKGELVKE